MDFHSFLQTLPDLSSLSNDQLNTLEHSMMVNTYPDGYEFFSENSKGDNIFLIIDGQVSVTHNRGKKCGFLEIKRHRAGEWFGIVSVIEKGIHEATCKAIGEVTAASLPASAFKLLYDSNVPLAQQIQHSINNQIAKDYRSLVKLIRKVIFDIEDGKDFEYIMNKTLSQYNGPERRAQSH